MIYIKRSDEAYLVQEISLNAWPAKYILFLNGWLLRISEGITSRANSVLPLHYRGNNLAEDVRVTEIAYKKYHLPVEFQITDICAPLNLSSKLTALGYQKIKPSSVMIIEIKDLNRKTVNKAFNYLYSVNESDQWFRALMEIENLTMTRMNALRKIIKRIQAPQTIFVSAMNRDQTVGVLLGVLERGYIGIFDLAVRSQFRRQNIASSLIHTLAKWGTKQSARKLYLQVQNDNQSAVTLYQKLGFRLLYNYHYMLKND